MTRRTRTVLLHQGTGIGTRGVARSKGCRDRCRGRAVDGDDPRRHRTPANGIRDGSRPAEPRPDGQRIAFQSYRDGNFNIWTIAADGGEIKELTRGPFDQREPKFSPNGGSIAFSSDRSVSYGIYVLDVATGATRTWADMAAEEYEPAWSPDGKEIAFVSGGTSIVATDSSGNPRTIATGASTAQLHAPAWSPEGTQVYYVQIYNAASKLMRAGNPVFTREEVSPFPIALLSADDYVYVDNGEIRRMSAGARGISVRGPRWATPGFASLLVCPAYGAPSEIVS